MINSTILRLSTILLSNSPFSLSTISGYHIFSVEKSFFTRSINTLFYFNIFIGNATFSKTTFDSIIGGAIRVDLSYVLKYQIIENQFYVNATSQNYYFFENCNFHKCQVTGKQNNGGAISINVHIPTNIDIDTSFEFTSFYDCHSEGKGGAIYLYKTGDVSILESCFLQCFTSCSEEKGTGTVAYIHHRSSTERGKIRGSSFYGCPQSNDMHPNTDTVLYAYMGKSAFSSTNFTQNKVNHGSSALFILEQKVISIDFTSFINLTGENTIHFIGNLYATADIDSINVVNCVNNNGDLNAIFIFRYTTINVENSVFIMKTNKNLAINDSNDTHDFINFNKCHFDLPQEELVNESICKFQFCHFDVINPATIKSIYFDSRECWDVNRFPKPTKTPEPTQSPFATPTKTPAATSCCNECTGNKILEKYYKLIFYVGVAIAFILIIIFVFLICKCIFDLGRKKNSDKISSSASLSSSLISHSPF